MDLGRPAVYVLSDVKKNEEVYVIHTMHMTWDKKQTGFPFHQYTIVSLPIAISPIAVLSKRYCISSHVIS